jgi:DNA-binding transcriptional ArsR family regulator
MIMDSTAQGRHAQEERAKEVSRHLLGSNSRLLVAVAIAGHDSGIVYARGLAKVTQLPDNVVRADLKKLSAAGLLIEQPRLEGNQPVYYERVDSVFWDMCPVLLEECSPRVARTSSVSAKKPGK